MNSRFHVVLDPTGMRSILIVVYFVIVEYRIQFIDAHHVMPPGSFNVYFLLLKGKENTIYRVFLLISTVRIIN